MKIKKAFNVTDLFSFHEITEDKLTKKNSKLDGSKATPFCDIPAEMLKSTTDVPVSLLIKIINSSIRNGCTKFLRLPREYFSSAVLVLNRSPEIQNITQRDIFQLNFSQIDGII